MQQVKKKIGRPRKPAAEQGQLVAVRWPPGLIERADALAEGRPDKPLRSSIMREALAAGLDVLERRRKK